MKISKAAMGIFLVGWLLSAAPAAAQAEQVTVSIPQFPVTVNDVQVDNAYRQYPFLVYRDITYFPMTYYDCRFLGLETQWSKEQGLNITQRDISAGYRTYSQDNRNHYQYQAQIVQGPVWVNKTLIDNEKEPYPLLSFRNVTYFPLTWRFASNSFGWQYAYNDQMGLQIHSSNKIARPLDLYEQNDYRDFMVVNNSILYQTKTGLLYQQQLNSPWQRQAIFQFPKNRDYDNAWHDGTFRDENGVKRLFYQDGGSTIDHSITYSRKVNADGTIGIADNPAWHYLSPDIAWWIEGQPKDMQNRGTDFVVSDQGKEKRFQRPGLLWDCNPAAVKLQGRDVYLLGGSRYERNQLYKINLDTGSIVKVSDAYGYRFLLDGDRVYLEDQWEADHNFSVLQLETGTLLQTVPLYKEQMTYPSNDLASFQGKIYYRDPNLTLCCLNQRLPDAITNTKQVTSIQNLGDYLMICFKDRPEIAVRTLILDRQAHVVYQSSDVIDKFSLDGNQLVYRVVNSPQLYWVTL